MGTDISMFVEVRRSGQWTHVRPPNGIELDPRSYAYFDALGLGCGDYDCEPLARSRGLPMDVSHDVRSALTYLDYGVSWLGIDEYLTVDMSRPFPVHAGFAPRTYGDALRPIRDALPWLRSLGEPKDVRLVFWFDN